MFAEAAETLARASRVVVFSGAGVSAESGIDTFRGDGGLWQRYPAEEVGTLPGLLKMMATDPPRLARFLRELLEPIVDAEPNAGHRALAELERLKRERFQSAIVVTQNVDALHQAAGSEGVLEIHGSLFRIVDARGHLIRDLTREQLRAIVDELRGAERGLFRRLRITSALTPLFGLGYRPSVVLFGEPLPEPTWSHAVQHASAADAMLVVGTSGAVYPAAALPEQAAAAGARIIGVGPERGDAHVWLEGRAGEVLPELVAAIAARR